MVESRNTVVVAEADPGLRTASCTDAGRHRRGNEDSHLAEFPVYIVADGMGGHDAGDVASATVVRAFTPLVGRDDVRPEEVADAIRRAHRTVSALSDRTRRGAGSTLTGVVQVRHEGLPYWLVVNVGDSRVYRVQGPRFERMTIDHSILQEQLDAGLLTLEEADDFAHKNVITRAVGAPDSPADYWVHPVEPGERLLICSDGLHGEVTEAEMLELMSTHADPGEAVEALLDRALDNGGHDNVTVILVDVDPVAASGADADADAGTDAGAVAQADAGAGADADAVTDAPVEASVSVEGRSHD